MSGSKFKQYAPQTGTYSVKVKTGSNWRDFNTCRLQVSVGQPYHEGEKFQATMNWVSERFENIILCVNDTLQRYNTLAENPALSEDQSAVLWNKMGSEWIERNSVYFSSATNCTIYRWDDWILSPEYEERHNQVMNFFSTNANFRSSIQKNVMDFWHRKAMKDGQHSIESQLSFIQQSERYLLEETAVFAMMFQKHNAVDIYPGTTLLPATLFRGNPVPGMPEGLDKGAFTRIDFGRNQQKIRPLMAQDLHTPSIAA